ncbi:MAG: hypothetical protein WCF60_13470 [Anaerobacillus sp.]
MIVTGIAYEHLEKERSNSPEDSFVRSSVTYKKSGKEEVFHVLYPAFFAEKATIDGVWAFESPVHEVVALNLLPVYPGRKRLYISEEDEFLRPLQAADLSRLLLMVENIKSKGSYQYI